MRLLELEPEWVYDYAPPGTMRRSEDIGIRNAQGVMFLCPVCFVKNGGARGTESVLCWFRDRGVPDDASPGPGRWTVTGTGFDDLTLSPSVNVANEHWHGWVMDGAVT